jgi:hypothetical protein
VPVPVVYPTALGIGEDLVGLRRLLELLLGLGVVGVDVGVKLAGQPPERLLQLGLPHAAGDAQDLVVVGGHRELAAFHSP